MLVKDLKEFRDALDLAVNQLDCAIEIIDRSDDLRKFRDDDITMSLIKMAETLFKKEASLFNKREKDAALVLNKNKEFMEVVNYVCETMGLSYMMNYENMLYESQFNHAVIKQEALTTSGYKEVYYILRNNQHNNEIHLSLNVRSPFTQSPAVIPDIIGKDAIYKYIDQEKKLRNF